MTPDSIPWDDFDCLFIGGDDAFKESDLIRRTCSEARSPPASGSTWAGSTACDAS